MSEDQEENHTCLWTNTAKGWFQRGQLLVSPLWDAQDQELELWAFSTSALNQMCAFGEMCLFTNPPLQRNGVEGSQTNSELVESSGHKSTLEHLLQYGLLDPSPEILIPRVWGGARESALLTGSPVGLLIGRGPHFEHPEAG